MEGLQIGDRIGFILKLRNEKKHCYFVGYGIYEGEFKPDIEDFKNIKKKKRIKMIENIKGSCRFKLDSGETVWQWQGWWLSEERFKEVFINDCYKEGWKVINVDMKGKRCISKI